MLFSGAVIIFVWNRQLTALFHSLCMPLLVSIVQLQVLKMKITCI